MGYIDVNGVSLSLPDGRLLLDEVSFRVGEGTTSALIGANGAGKSTLLRMIRGDIRPESGAISIDGGLGVMDQFVGHLRDASTVRDLPISVAPARVRKAALALDRTELAIIEHDSLDTQMAYATALAEYADAGGYDQETVWDQCTVAALGLPFERAKYREVRALSGGEQKRLVLEALLRGPDEVLLLDEPDNYLDVPAKRWLEDSLRASQKTVLLVSHDRELLARAADRIITLELGAAGNTAWTHGGGFGTYHPARRDRMDRLDELRRRWDEQHAKLGARVVPGWFAQVHEHPSLLGRTLLDILHRGDDNRDGMAREAASRAPDRYGLAEAAEQNFESLSGGQQARLQILLLELSGATLLLLDEPTDNLDLVSAEALQSALERFEGTVIAVTHDRWFARSFDRFLVFGADGQVYESLEPVWDEARVIRPR